MLAIAACGTAAGAGPVATSSAHSHTIVSVKSFSGVGKVLVTSSGRPLYSPSQESSHKILCTGSCTSVWIPLRAGKHAPTGPSSAGKLRVIKRPDGIRQVTAGGKPLYTFVNDRPGKLTGNGASDSFNGKNFTWHAVLARNSTPAPSNSGSTTSTMPGYGY